MHSLIAEKIISKAALHQKLAVWRLRSNRIVFTNGVFDLVHPGHADYLTRASQLGQRLVVGLNSDSSVKKLHKGDDRPINNQEFRASILAALHAVDAVVIFDEETPIELIEAIAPDVLVKGGDYDPEERNQDSKSYIVGSDAVIASGGQVAVIPFLEGFSSTSIIEKIRSYGQD